MQTKELSLFLLGTSMLVALPAIAQAGTGLYDALNTAATKADTTASYQMTSDETIPDDVGVINTGSNLTFTINSNESGVVAQGTTQVTTGNTLNVNTVGGYTSGTTPAHAWTGTMKDATTIQVKGGTLNTNNSVFANTVVDNTEKAGAVVQSMVNGATGGTVNIKSTDFVNNQITNSFDRVAGGVAYVEEGSKLNISNGSSFVSNSATSSIASSQTEPASLGGAVYNFGQMAIGQTGVTTDRNQFIQNQAEIGGAIYNGDTGQTTSQNAVYRANNAQGLTGTTTGAGGAVYNAGVYTATNDTYENNTANANGGAIYNRGTATVSESLFKGNTSQKDSGAVRTTGGTYTSQSNRYESNTSGFGGALGNESGVLNSTGDVFKNNTATDGGAIISSNAPSQTATPAQTNVTQGTFTNNTATNVGGAIAVSGGVTTVSGNTSFTGNSAKLGGAIYNASGATLNLEGSGITFAGNSATEGGSAIANDGTLNIKNAEDTIDLFYNPYVEGGPLPSPATRMFADNEDIDNIGTINIDNSRLQLHQGINSVSKAKSGSVNLKNNSTVDIGYSTVYADKVSVDGTSTLMTHLKVTENAATDQYGKVEANTITANNGSTLKIFTDPNTYTQLAKGTVRQFEILDGDDVTDNFKLQDNNIYDITRVKDGVYQIKIKDGPVPPSDFPPCPGCDANENSTHDGWWTDYPEGSGNETADAVMKELNDMIYYGDAKDYREALDGLAHDVSPLIQAHSTEIMSRLGEIVRKHQYTSMERTGYVHRGKRFYKFPRRQSNLWVDGMVGKSKFDTRKGWDMDTKGIAVGLDGHVSEATKMGIAYAYTNADGTSVGRDTEIKSHTGMIYGEYNPNRFYANWMGLYTRSEYDENKKVGSVRVKANYDVDVLGAQVMFGRKLGPWVSGDWSTGVLSPEIGARYVYTKQHGYTDTAGQKVGSADGQTLTGILGAQYTIGYTLSPTLAWYPELRAALTYDIVEPDTKNTVTLVNGTRYQLTTDKMDRFGVEVGARVGLDINRKAEIGLEYDGLFKGDYTNHTGMANLKYKF